MDVLFPFAARQQQQQPPPSDGENFHSLPHPEEHASRYGAGPRNPMLRGDDGQGQSQRQLGGQQPSFRRPRPGGMVRRASVASQASQWSWSMAGSVAQQPSSRNLPSRQLSSRQSFLSMGSASNHSQSTGSDMISFRSGQEHSMQEGMRRSEEYYDASPQQQPSDGPGRASQARRPGALSASFSPMDGAMDAYNMSRRNLGANGGSNRNLSSNGGSSRNLSAGLESDHPYDDEGYYDEDEEEAEEDLPVSPLRQLLDAINMSILPTSLRLSGLAQAVEFFDHRDKAMHDAELREGGAFVLYHKLGLVLRLSRCGDHEQDAAGMRNHGSLDKKGGGPNGGNPNQMMSYQQHLHHSMLMQQQSEFDKEIAMICSCLEMVHRANPDAIAQTWDDCGTEILPLLVHVLERPFLKIERAVWMTLQQKANVPGSLERAVATAVTRDQKLAVQKVTKVLAMYSLVPEAKEPMTRCDGMLKWLTRIVDTHNHNRHRGQGGVDNSLRSSLRGDRNLHPQHESEDEKIRAQQRQELAARAMSGSGLYMTEAARFNTIATLTNLAALEANRMAMLHEPGLLDNICRAVHNERSDVPKQCSALAIMNLSNGDMDHVPEMARNDLVLETLLRLMREDNPETRRNAVVTVFNVACSDQNTVRLARYRDGTVLEALVELVSQDDPMRSHEEARANAAETLFNMSCSEISETTDRMANHAGLLECLAVTLRGEHTGLEVKMYCSAALRRFAEIVHHPMIAQGALLSAMVKASAWTDTDCIAEAFRAQAAVPENCVVMARHHGLLNALSRLALAGGEGGDAEGVRMASCLAIELMSRVDEARALLSHNEGIIAALTRASYGDDGGLLPVEVGGGEGSYGGGDYGEDDEESDGLRSRRIQVALKNLVSAM